MKKTVKGTYLVTPGHGYLKISKKNFIKVGGDPDGITKYSGMTFENVYLEEDVDFGRLEKAAAENGYKILYEVKHVGGVLNTHNFNPKLFHWKPEVGQKLEDAAKRHLFEITKLERDKIHVRCHKYHKNFWIPKSKAFIYIENIVI